MGVTWCCDSSMAMNNHTTTWTSSTLKLDDLLKTRRNFEECVKFPKRDIESRDESLTNRTSDHWNRLRDTKSEGKQILQKDLRINEQPIANIAFALWNPETLLLHVMETVRVVWPLEMLQRHQWVWQNKELCDGVIQKLQGSMEDHKIKKPNLNPVTISLAHANHVAGDYSAPKHRW